MHRFFIIVSLFFLVTLNAQSKKKNFNNIIKSQDIPEITEFLEVAHPDDPRRPILKKRLIQLKNEAWTKGKEHHKPMEARKIEESIVANPLPVIPDETEEFNQLMNISSGEHKNKTVKILNSLFDEDPTSKEAIVMIDNKSDCNIIVRIQGDNGKSYNLPVFAKKENLIVVEKGNYTFNSLICGTPYSSKKYIYKAFMVTLNQPQPANH